MLNCYIESTDQRVIPIQPIMTSEFPKWLDRQDDRLKTWINSTHFTATAASFCCVPSKEGQLEKVLIGIGHEKDMFSMGVLPSALSSGIYKIVDDIKGDALTFSSISWGLGSYQFTPYKKSLTAINAKLLLSNDMDVAYVNNTVKATYLIRDLINTPTEDMGPAELGEAVVKIADEFNGKVKQIVGDDLLKKGFPAIHAFGRASIHEPRLIELRWGNKNHPKVTLVGKGVCFDTGGLNLKPPLFMLTMKKDMGGAAHALGLARMIMSAKLPLYLHVLIPAIENSLSDNSIRPGDIVPTRNGINVEIINTDAEGRVILADALTEAVSEKPDLLIDFATLTGAARVALGPDLPAYFTYDDTIAKDIEACALKASDPVWRLPIYQPYRSALNSLVGDIVNAEFNSVGGGAIMAAIFLSEFIPREIPWIHFDIMAWNLTAKPSRPVGGEAMGLRTAFQFLCERFC